MAGIGSINFSGLASGLDTDKIIEQLVQVDSQPLVRLQSQKDDATKKRDIYTTLKSDLLNFKTAVSELRSQTSFNQFSASSSNEEALTVSASASAGEGTHTLRVLSLAQAMTLSGGSLAAKDSALGLSGSTLINNSIFTIDENDTLSDISAGINSLNAGVQASVLTVKTGDNRLLLTAGKQGAAGFTFANIGGSTLLGALGFTDGTLGIREIDNGMVKSAGFLSQRSTIDGMLDFGADTAGTVKIQGVDVGIDLASDSLTDIRDRINGLGISGISAQIETTENDGDTRYRLSISGTQSFTDDNNVLEILGILAGGTSGTRAEFQTGVIGQSSDTGLVNSNLSSLGATAGETIAITGTRADGTAVSQSFGIDKNTDVQDILDAIEEAFGGDVTADVENGRVVVRSVEAGRSSLSVGIKANNEAGGTLNFGSVTNTEIGRDRLVQAGSDSSILVNNIEVTRTNNEITDVLSGLTFTLKEANPDTDVVLTVERDREGIKGKVEAFVTAYNDFVTYVAEQSGYDTEKKEAGPLNGDQTVRTILSRIQMAYERSVLGDGDFRNLVEVGIETGADGKLSINADRLNEALATDMDSVVSLFAATRSSSDTDISLVYHSTASKTGTYAVTVTRAPERAQAVSDAFVAPQAGGTLTLTDSSGAALNVAYESGMNAEDIAATINETAATKTARELISDEAFSTSEGDTVTRSTAIADLTGTVPDGGGSITVTGTTRAGRSFTRQVAFNGSGTGTVGDLLSTIEQANSNEVIASLDSDGRIILTDKTAGPSKLALSLDLTAAGLQDGGFTVAESGRNTVPVEATVSDGRLVLTHKSYGSALTFTVAGGSAIGLADGSYAGVDVAGTINGRVATGSGTSLTAAADDPSASGIVIRTVITPEKLAQEGADQGTVTLVAGIADRLYSELSSITDTVNGYIQANIDGVERSIEGYDDDIDEMNRRIDIRREQYVRKFTALEQALATLQTLQQSLNASLSSLSQVSLSA